MPLRRTFANNPEERSHFYPSPCRKETTYRHFNISASKPTDRINVCTISTRTREKERVMEPVAIPRVPPEIDEGYSIRKKIMKIAIKKNV